MEKEDSTWFERNIKKKIRDLLPRYLGGIFFLVLLFSFVVLVYAIIYRVHTNTESARYMLSALVQSQAAIIAIVISLTLITVQLTASAYSIRVLNIFKRSFGWQLLFISYGISIFYGLLVLKMIKGANDFSHELSAITYLNIPLETHINNVYSLGCLTFLILIMYLMSIINLLNPVNIINRLKIEITKDNLLNSEEDPIQPIMDIVHGSIMKYDLETTRVGLKAVTERVIGIIDSDGEKKISERFCKYLERVDRWAISRDDEDATIEVIENLGIFGKSTVGKKLRTATYLVETSLEDFGIAAAEKRLEEATRIAAGWLKKIGVAAAENTLDNATGRAANSLENVGVAAAGQKLSFATGETARYLQEVGIAAAEKKLKEDVIKQVAMSLVIVGIHSAEKGLEPATWQVAKSLAELTILSEKVVKPIVQEFKPEFMRRYERELEKLQAKNKNSK